jgi:hypothetical protein
MQNQGKERIMRDSIGRRARLTLAVVVGGVIGCGQAAWAGWTGSMNGSGYGKASANVTSSTLKSNAANSAVMTNPSASITPTNGYSAGASLPSGASSKTYSRVKGLSGYVWQASTVATNGDKTDNSWLQSYVIPTSTVASASLEVLSSSVDTSGTNGCPPGQALYTFIWHWNGSDAGTAQAITWYEYDDPLPGDFNGDFSSLPNVAWLTDYLSPNIGCEGPCYRIPSFDEVVTNSFCANADSNKIYMVTDGVAVSVFKPCPLTFSGFLPPIGGADATGGGCNSAVRGFKLGSTIPVKMNVVDCNGFPVTEGNHTIQVSRCDSSTGGEAAIDATPTDAATTGNLFRLTDATTGQWHFNWGTKGFGAGTWKIIVTLSDGSVHYVYVDLKR